MSVFIFREFFDGLLTRFSDGLDLLLAVRCSDGLAVRCSDGLDKTFDDFLYIIFFLFKGVAQILARARRKVDAVNIDVIFILFSRMHLEECCGVYIGPYGFSWYGHLPAPTPDEFVS